MSLPKYTGSKKSEQFQLLIFGGSIKKIYISSALANCDEIQAVNYLTGGSKVREVYEQLRTFKKDHSDTRVKSMIIHVGTNHLPRNNPVDVINKICRLIVYGSK